MESTDPPISDPGSIAGVAARLALWGCRAPKGLARVEFDSDFSRRKVDAVVRASCEAVGVPFFSLDLPRQTPAAQVVVWLTEQIASLPHGIVSITGWNTAFPPDVLLEESLRVLNYNRETLAQFPLCQIWWLPRPLASAFSLRIPDLNSWFIVRLSLTENIASPRDDTEQLASSLASPASQATARKHADSFALRFQMALDMDTPLPELAALADAAVETLDEVGLGYEAQTLSESLVEQIVISSAYKNLQSGTLSIIDSDAFRFYRHMAGLYQSQHDYARAADALQHALAAAERLYGPENDKVAFLLNQLGNIRNKQGRFADTEPLYQRTLTIYEQALGKEHSFVATALSNLAMSYKNQGRYTDAEPLYLRALAIHEKALGLDHPELATSLNNLASLYTSQGRYADAEPLYLRALAIREKALGLDHPQVATCLNNLSGLYDSQGRYLAAQSLYQRALKIMEATVGLQHPNYATVLGNYAGNLRKLEGESEADGLDARVEAIREAHRRENPS